MNFYTTIFKDAKVDNITRYGRAGPGPEGGIMTATLELAGQSFMALNGGPIFTFTEAISFFVHCDSQPEVDDLWSKLSTGGEEGRCGWLKDKFGISWQIIPNTLGELVGGPDPKKSQRAMQAMLRMGKINIAKLQRAYDGA